jgi:hypothetical protein
MGMLFVEMVLRVVPRGAQLVEEADGIAALEALQQRGPGELQDEATALMDEFFGETYGLEEG